MKYPNEFKLIEEAASHIVNCAIIVQQNNEDTQDIAEKQLKDWFDKLESLMLNI